MLGALGEYLDVAPGDLADLQESLSPYSWYEFGPLLRDTLIEEGGDSECQRGVGERPNDQRGCCRAAG